MKLIWSALLLAFTSLFPAHLCADGSPPHEGQQFTIGAQKITVLKVQGLSFVENEYSKRFRFDSVSNPKLKALRERYRLDEITASGKDEFERQVLLMDWVHHRFKRFGQPSKPVRGALDILESIDAGHTFFCSQYTQLMASAAASLGWVDRVLALRRHKGVNARGGSTEHSTTEIWSNQHSKWIMLDPTSNMYLEKRGVPLNAWEIRQEWFYNEGRELVWVVGKDQKRYRKSDLPIFLKRFEDFGDLTIEPDELDKYGFIGYIPNTDLMDSGYDYGQMFIVKDELCDGTQWHKRDLPRDPASEPYFPLGQAALELEPRHGSLHVKIKSLTPNLKRFEIRNGVDGWTGSAETFDWKLTPGLNRLEVRTVNAFGVPGPSSVVEAELE